MAEAEKKEVELSKKGETFKVRKGAYHRATGIPEDEPIPMSRIEKDIEKGGKIGRMARSAKGFKAMHHKGESEEYDANGFPYLAEKEHPNTPLGTVKGHKTTKKQQALFGIARGMQKGETPTSYSPQAAKIAGGVSGKEGHKLASKPKGGYRKSPKESRYAEAEINRQNRFGSRPRPKPKPGEPGANIPWPEEQRAEFPERDRPRKKVRPGESALERVMQMVSQIEAENDGSELSEDFGNPDLPSHVASDTDKFSEIFRRLDVLEKRLLGS